MNPRRSPWIACWSRPGLAFLMVIGLVGCDFFKPSRPEINTVGIPLDYRSPNATLKTMELAIEDKASSNGYAAYSGALADTTVDPRSFHAFLDPVTRLRLLNSSVTPETLWTKSLEQSFYSNVSQLGLGATYRMSWAQDPLSPSDDSTATTALLHRSYLVVAQPDGSRDTLIVGIGFADLEFVLSRGNWKLVRWQDREDPNAAVDDGQLCFGQLRQENR
jgi:hypothetical protein